MKILKPSFLLLSSILLSIVPVKISKTCAWGYDEDENILSPFNAEILHMPELYPWFYSYHYYNGGETDYSSQNTNSEQFSIFDGTEKNIEEWKTYFNNPNITSENIYKVLYTTGLEDFNAFDAYITGSGTLSDEWKNNPLLQHWKTNKKNPSFDYFYFAKSTEPLVQGVDYWEAVARDTAALTSAKLHALKKISMLKEDAFLRLRYAYQAMRAAHYTGDYAACKNIFEKYVQNANDGSQTYYWCLSLYAGAYWRQGNFAEASYYNSIVFDKCLSRKLYAERDFWIDNENTWQKCLAMCENNHEKEILWLLTGINQNNSAIPALYEMMKLNVASDAIELLLAREMEKIQRNYMPMRWDDDFDTEDEYDYRPESNDLNEIYIFITKALATGKVKTPAFWHNAAAFIQYINQEYESCNNHTKLALQAAGADAELASQSKILQVINTIDSAGTINAEIEKRILPQLEWLYKAAHKTIDDNMYSFSFSSEGDAYRIAMHRLMKYYLAARKPVQAEMCRAQAVEYYDAYEEPEKMHVDDLIAFFTNKNNSAFSQFLATQYPYSLDDLYEIKGTLLMREYNWKDATATFKKMKNRETHEKMQLPTDPFLIHINDCHDCDFEEHPSEYTKLSLCEKMTDLENLLTAADMNHAQTYHQLANAYYNISYWGNSWMAIDYYRCHGCETSYKEYENEDWYVSDFYTVSKAISYYTLSAESTANKELKAQNYFMLAKCEQNMYYVSNDYSYMNEDGQKIKYRNYFKKLKTEYKNTAFYKDAIDECKYFDYYVNLR